MPMTIPRILIAGAKSGSGKTTLTLGIVSALRRRGLKVQMFKAGPDFLDPTWLAAASGRPCYNLDGWMSSREYVERLFNRVSRNADLAIIEGVMGLFDGADASGLAGSSAEIAKWLNAPVLLVVDTHGMARSIAPLAAGFAGFEKGVEVRGLIANNCGSEKHREILNEALASAKQPALAGSVPRNGFPELKSRHLGLVTADRKHDNSTDVFDDFANSAENHLDLDEVLNIARSAGPFPSGKTGQIYNKPPSRQLTRLAVARDESFHFYYQDFFDELEQRGCRIVFFSPLHDRALPGDIDALYLGGGYPEEFAEELAANQCMLASIRDFVGDGGLVYAECGGLMYLSQAIITIHGDRQSMLGILPAETRMRRKRKRLGYVDVTFLEDTVWGTKDLQVRGHEFHYSELVSEPAADQWSLPYVIKDRKGNYGEQQGRAYQNLSGNVLTSYAHLYLASCPEAMNYFINMCIRSRQSRMQKTTEQDVSQ